MPAQNCFEEALSAAKFLGWLKFFVLDQTFIYVFWQSQIFCDRQKDDLHSVKLVFVPAQKFSKRILNAVKFFGWLKVFGQAQNILVPVKGQGIIRTKIIPI